jgi:hypothetical protein
MRAVLLSFLVIFLVSCEQTSVEYLWAKPLETDGKDAMILSFPESVQLGNGANLIASAKWNANLGECEIQRSMIEFDLSEIPSDARILYAEMRLFNAYKDELETNSEGGSQNECVIRRITEDWNEHEVNWLNQPEATNEHQVFTKATSADRENLSVDITRLVADMKLHGNHGLMIQLADETGNRRQAYASSDAFDEQFHPELIVEYEITTNPMGSH